MSRPYLCYADKKRIQQVLMNLLANALKFTPSKGQITIRVGLMDQKIEIQVEDSGIGISQLDQQKLFKMFGYLKSTQ